MVERRRVINPADRQFARQRTQQINTELNQFQKSSQALLSKLKGQQIRRGGRNAMLQRDRNIRKVGISSQLEITRLNKLKQNLSRFVNTPTPAEENARIRVIISQANKALRRGIPLGALSGEVRSLVKKARGGRSVGLEIFLKKQKPASINTSTSIPAKTSFNSSSIKFDNPFNNTNMSRADFNRNATVERIKNNTIKSPRPFSRIVKSLLFR